jgi:hypothetical protein
VAEIIQPGGDPDKPTENQAVLPGSITGSGTVRARAGGVSTAALMPDVRAGPGARFVAVRIWPQRTVR